MKKESLYSQKILYAILIFLLAVGIVYAHKIHFIQPTFKSWSQMSQLCIGNSPRWSAIRKPENQSNV